MISFLYVDTTYLKNGHKKYETYALWEVRERKNKLNVQMMNDGREFCQQIQSNVSYIR